jgi:hypothetical protein
MADIAQYSRHVSKVPIGDISLECALMVDSFRRRF